MPVRAVGGRFCKTCGHYYQHKQSCSLCSVHIQKREIFFNIDLGRKNLPQVRLDLMLKALFVHGKTPDVTHHSKLIDYVNKGIAYYSVQGDNFTLMGESK